jgi:predicted nucleotidyltransferase
MMVKDIHIAGESNLNKHINHAMRPAVLDRIVESLAARSEVQSIILFGSRAHGDATPRSDIDLAVSAPQANLRQWLDLKMLVEQADTLLPVTLVRLESSPAELRDRIVTEGIILYEHEKNTR